MKLRTKWRVAAIIFVYLVAIEGFAQAAEVNEPSKLYKGEIRFRYDWIGVNRDRGRFREDNWMTDGSTGGFDWLHIESTGPDKNGYEWLFEGRAMYDYDYDLSFLVKKQDSHYLKLDFDSSRRYYDGSNKFWRPSGVNLAEKSDFDLFVDRRNYNIEFGLTPVKGPQWVFGWNRMEKDGKEVLLRNSTGAVSGGTFRGVPTISNLRGITDTIYGEVSQTFAEKYNFKVRQEFEQYHAEQRGDVAATYDSAGVSNNRWAKDDLGYTNWRTMVMFDSFLDKENYVTANYMYNRINNNSTRNYYRNTLYLAESDVDNSKRTNVYGIGYRKANLLQIQGLDLSVGVRIEDSETDADSIGWRGSDFLARSNLDEMRVAEVLQLVYKGIKRTTLSFDAKLEQRQLKWDATDSLNPDNFDRKTDTDFLDQIYTFKAVHRFSNDIKSTVSFKIKDLERRMTNRFDVDPGAYPGWLGNYRTTGSDFLVKTDFRLNNKTSATLLYQYLQENIGFERGGRTSDQETHRGSGSISFNPTQNLFLVGTFMLENRTIDTPGVEASKRPYDFSGNSYSLMLDATYAFNEKTSTTLGFRHTEAMGNADVSGDYVFDKVGLTLKHKFAANKTVGMGYEFYNFNNHAGGSFDDYSAHGAFVTYTYTF